MEKLKIIILLFSILPIQQRIIYYLSHKPFKSYKKLIYIFLYISILSNKMNMKMSILLK